MSDLKTKLREIEQDYRAGKITHAEYCAQSILAGADANVPKAASAVHIVGIGYGDITQLDKEEIPELTTIDVDPA